MRFGRSYEGLSLTPGWFQSHFADFFTKKFKIPLREMFLSFDTIPHPLVEPNICIYKTSKQTNKQESVTKESFVAHRKGAMLQWQNSSKLKLSGQDPLAATIPMIGRAISIVVEGQHSVEQQQRHQQQQQ